VQGSAPSLDTLMPYVALEDGYAEPRSFRCSTLRDLREFPASVQRVFGYALHVAQLGGRHPDTKDLEPDEADT
jgi:phage-related protein